MIKLLQNVYMIFKALIFEWFPIFSEMRKAIWGPLGQLKESIGTIVTVIVTAIALVKFLDKYGISTWGNGAPRKRKKNRQHREP